MDDTPVRTYMSTPLLTIDADADAAEAARAMREVGIKSVAVTGDDCDPHGILTSSDFVEMAADDRRPGGTTVGDYATTDPITVSPDATLAEAAATMRENDAHHLPVVDEDGSAVGMLTASDVVARAAGAEAPSAEPGE
ncbi:MAG: CBS domain-containing protein [Haloferacaceae archaeon]